MPSAELRSQTVVVLTPSANDGLVAKRMLESAGLEVRVCSDMTHAVSCIDAGVGALLIAEEALGRAGRGDLMASLERQPTWSDLPVVLLLSTGELSDGISPRVGELAARGNVTLLERPVRVATLVSTLRSALRARTRQYDVRDSMAERVAAAEVLRESEGRLRAAVLAAPYPLMLHAEDGAVLQLSRAWSELSGYAAEELTTTSEWTRRAYGDGAPDADALMRQDFDRSDSSVAMSHAYGERQIRTRDGQLRTWDFQVVPLGSLPDGRRLRLVAATDVTDVQRLLASERAARQEAEGANRAKMDFLAVMSHELRTPLNAIGGYTQLLELGIHGPVTEAQRGALARIMSSEEHLLGLIEDVLNFAKIEAGRVMFDPQPIAVEELVASVDALVEPQMREKGIAYEREPAPSVDALVDAEKARQVLLNLLSNAVKFTPAGGSIRVGYAARASDVEIHITDSGIGIPADKQAAIFEPFVQVHRQYTSPTGGTGLGLAISRDLARAMGGELTVQSTVGQGSTFVLAVPRAGESDAG